MYGRQELVFHRRVRAGYLALIATEPHRWRIVDACHSVEQIQTEIRQGVKSLLEAKGTDGRLTADR